MTRAAMARRLAALESTRLERLAREGEESLYAEFGNISAAEIEARLAALDPPTEREAAGNAVIAHLTPQEAMIIASPNFHRRDLPRLTPLMWKALFSDAPLSAREVRVLRALKPGR